MIRPYARSLIVSLAVAALGLGEQALAQEDRWEPPLPSSDPDDWIQLVSGEWLRGELQILRDDNLEFESEELDKLHLDWDNVVVFRSSRIHTYVFDEGGSHSGTAVMQGDTLVVQTEQQERRLPRSDLISIIEGRPTEWNFWSAKMSVGFIGRAGNTDQRDLNSIVLIRRDASRSRINLEYRGNLSKTNDVLTVNSHRAVANLSFLISRGFFVTPIAGGLYSDEFQNIDLRASIAAGAGLFLVRKSGLEWYVQLVAGYQPTTFVSVVPGEDDTDKSAAIIPITSLEMGITGSLEFAFRYNSSITVPDTKGTVHHLFALLSYELTSLLDFDISITWDRIKNPKPRADETVPERDDFRLFFGLGVDI